MARIFFLCFLLLAFSGGAHALSWQICHKENVMKDYPVVFKGTAVVTETAEEMLTQEDIKAKKRWDEKQWLDLGGEPRVTTFRVVEGYKGGVGGFGAEIKLFHRSSAALGASYNKNETYVVFARKDAQGHFILPLNCHLGGKAGTIPTNGRTFADLKIYNHQAEYLRKLIAAHPDNRYFYLEQGAFHEKYDEFALAEQDYKTGLMKATGKSLSEALTSSGADPAATYFLIGYGRALYLQGKYEEALAPLNAQFTEENKRLYLICLAKLKRFDELKKIAPGLSDAEIKKMGAAP